MLQVAVVVARVSISNFRGGEVEFDWNDDNRDVHTDIELADAIGRYSMGHREAGVWSIA